MKNLIDLHTHTVLSTHAYSSLIENINQAHQLGLSYCGISDHAPALPGGQHIYAIHNMVIIPDTIQGVKVLKGVEVNIMNEAGDLDLTESDMSHLDYAIASIHGPCYGPSKGIEANTQAYLNAIKHPKVKILGHIDDSRQPSDYKRVAKACHDAGVLIEINNSSLRPESFRKNSAGNIQLILAACKEYQTHIIMNSDAHICFDIGRIEYCEAALKEADFPMELVVNYSETLIQTYFKTKK